jgi:hypothetical protein
MMEQGEIEVLLVVGVFVLVAVGLSVVVFWVVVSEIGVAVDKQTLPVLVVEDEPLENMYGFEKVVVEMVVDRIVDSVVVDVVVVAEMVVVEMVVSEMVESEVEMVMVMVEMVVVDTVVVEMVGSEMVGSEMVMVVVDTVVVEMVVSEMVVVEMVEVEMVGEVVAAVLAEVAYDCQSCFFHLLHPLTCPIVVVELLKYEERLTTVV